MTAAAVKEPSSTPPSESYKWVALANTTAAVFMSQLDGSIVLIALPAIFTGLGLDPLEPQNIGFLLWMLMGYRLAQAVLVVSVGRLGECSAGCGSTTPASWCSRWRASPSPSTPGTAPAAPSG